MRKFLLSSAGRYTRRLQIHYLLIFMKKKLMIVSWIILLLSNIYLLDRLSVPTLYLSKYSYSVKNPISIKAGFISINSGFKDECYYIWLLPYIFAVLLSLFLLILSLCSKKSKGNEE